MPFSIGLLIILISLIALVARVVSLENQKNANNQAKLIERVNRKNRALQSILITSDPLALTDMAREVLLHRISETYYKAMQLGDPLANTQREVFVAQHKNASGVKQPSFLPSQISGQIKTDSQRQLFYRSAYRIRKMLINELNIERSPHPDAYTCLHHIELCTLSAKVHEHINKGEYAERQNSQEEAYLYFSKAKRLVEQNSSYADEFEHLIEMLKRKSEFHSAQVIDIHTGNEISQEAQSQSPEKQSTEHGLDRFFSDQKIKHF